jgi:DnaJ-class molecular chaperone
LTLLEPPACCWEVLPPTDHFPASCPQPDAKERFIDAKRAFETLTDEESRRKYDFKMSMVSGWQ